MYLRGVAVAAPLGWSVVKLPPISTLPSACTATLLIEVLLPLPLGLGLKPSSSVPSLLSRAMRER